MRKKIVPQSTMKKHRSLREEQFRLVQGVAFMQAFTIGCLLASTWVLSQRIDRLEERLG